MHLGEEHRHDDEQQQDADRKLLRPSPPLQAGRPALALAELERQGEQRDGLGGAGELGPAGAEPEERLGPRESAEDRRLRQRARPLEQLLRALQLAEVRARPGLREESAKREVREP